MGEDEQAAADALMWFQQQGQWEEFEASVQNDFAPVVGLESAMLRTTRDLLSRSGMTKSAVTPR